MSSTDIQSMIQWLPEYAVGVQQVDREHEGLFSLAGRMHQAMLAGEGKQVLEGLLGELVRYTFYHFEHEEQFMKKIGYSGFEEHCKQHDGLRTRVRAMQTRAAAGERTMTIEVMLFLMDWLKTHILTSDRRIAEYAAQRRP